MIIDLSTNGEESHLTICDYVTTDSSVVANYISKCGTCHKLRDALSELKTKDRVVRPSWKYLEISLKKSQSVR